MLRIVNLEEIQGILQCIPSLIDLLEKGDTDFVAEVKRWFLKLERSLEGNRMSVVGKIAALRGMLISAERGLIPEGIVFRGRPTGRKIKEATAAIALRQAGELVSNAIEKDSERVAEAVSMGRQLVALAKAKGLIQPYIQDGTGDNTEKLRAMWRILTTDPNIAAGTVNMEGMIGSQDALIVLDRTVRHIIA